MSKLPSAVWALLLAGMGGGIALAVLFHHPDVNIALAVLAIGSNLVSGALGAFTGHAVAKSEMTATNNAVTMSQTDPK